jgi:hypothetical protein
LAVLSLMMALFAASAGADAYEPNDSLLESAGPLANHQVYSASIEAENDKDFFYFYATAPGSSVTLNVNNLGGGPLLAYVGFTVLDASGIPVGGASNIEEGRQKSVALTLEPQKYFVEVFSNLDYGAGYTLETGGGTGAFGPFATITGNCAAARSATTKARGTLTGAEGKLQRTTARERRSRYSAPAARKSAQTAYRKARARVTKERGALKAAQKSQRPWCFISQ